MGLDQMAYVIDGEHRNSLHDVGSTMSEQYKRLTQGVPLAEWRKHPGLQGWMVEFADYDQELFNNLYVLLDRAAIDRLEQAVRDGFPQAEGFFWGRMKNDQYRDRDLEFCRHARAALDRGQLVAYESSW